MTGAILRNLSAAILLLAASCSDTQRQDGPFVLAAASLQEALGDAADAWAEQGHPRPVLSFAGTAALARQIEAGATADLFISADEEWMDELAAHDAFLPGTRTSFLSNSLVLIAPAESDVAIEIAPGFALAEALGDGRLAIADPDAVPAGRYAKQALTALRVWPSVETRIVPTDNVRLALILVARREAVLGIVYATDAKVEPRVRILGTFPEASHTPISYPMAVLKTSQSAQAEAFRRYLVSDEAMMIFRRYGFRPGRGRSTPAS